jgi:hypothetical protein
LERKNGAKPFFLQTSIYTEKINKNKIIAYDSLHHKSVFFPRQKKWRTWK